MLNRCIAVIWVIYLFKLTLRILISNGNTCTDISHPVQEKHRKLSQSVKTVEKLPRAVASGEQGAGGKCPQALKNVFFRDKTTILYCSTFRVHFDGS
jgi:hypothetical protein